MIDKDIDWDTISEEELAQLPDLPSEEPTQSETVPKWEYPPRKHPKWGMVEKEGLIVGRGATKRVVPPDDVYRLAAYGCTMEEMSEFFQINRETLKYNFREYIAKGKAELKYRLRKAMLNNALQNNNAAVQIFLAKNLLGMSDNGLVNADNQPLPWTDS